MMWWYDGGWWAWAAMWLGMVLFWGLVLWVVVALLRGSESARGGTVRAAGPDPESILAARFARGEIDTDEYERRRAILRSDRAAA